MRFTRIPPAPVEFPPAWTWLVDEAIPAYVKAKYSPRDAWKDRPFAAEDVRFFFKGIEELSELFTEERPRAMPGYFAHPRFRSAYLLYYLPLQASKFIALFDRHPAPFELAMKESTVRVADLGAGPGTASIAFLLRMLGKGPRELPNVELEWFDNQSGIMEDGRDLVEKLASSFPRLRGKVKVNLHVMPWWKAPEVLKSPVTITLAGHVLNESAPPQQAWPGILELAQKGGTLFVEPASRKTSQQVSRLRDSFLDDELIEKSPEAIWGPCPHSEACPLGEGRDYCHFSIPVRVPGKWFREFSVGLGSERLWVKFSYLWLASREHRAPKPNPKRRLVLSDALKSPGGSTVVLLCEPNEAGRFPVEPRTELHRGDWVEIR